MTYILILFLVLYQEWINRRNIESIFNWMIHHPLYFLINLLTYLGIMSLLTFFLPEQISLLLVVVIGLFIGIGNKYKLLFRGDHLYPWDLSLGKESTNMSSFLNVFSVMRDCLVILFFIGLSLLSDINISWTPFLVSLTFAILAFLLRHYQEMPQMNQAFLHHEKGLTLAFILNLKEMFRYSTHRLRKSIEVKESTKLDNQKKMPNVIMIMSESFWDPSRLNHAEFSINLTPRLGKLRETSTFGEIVSPEFGGGTSNIEYEVLTGHNMAFLPSGVMAFNAYMNKPLDAIPRILASQGYETIGLHAYKSWFWGRDQVYKMLGFDQFHADEVFEDDIKGTYISDISFSHKVIDLYKESDSSLFLYGVTMQNHGPYEFKRYSSYDFELKAPLSDKDLGDLKCYGQGVYDADKALGQLIDFFEQEEEETYIVFFGDHLPMLGKNYSVYHKCGFIESDKQIYWSAEEKMKMASTPFVIWSNKSNESHDLGYLSPAKLGIEIMDRLPVWQSSFYENLHQVYKEHPIINKRIGFEWTDTLKAYMSSQMNVLFDWTDNEKNGNVKEYSTG